MIRRVVLGVLLCSLALSLGYGGVPCFQVGAHSCDCCKDDGNCTCCRILPASPQEQAVLAPVHFSVPDDATGLLPEAAPEVRTQVVAVVLDRPLSIHLKDAQLRI